MGNRTLTPVKKPKYRERLDWEKEFNTQINKIAPHFYAAAVNNPPDPPLLCRVLWYASDDLELGRVGPGAEEGHACAHRHDQCRARQIEDPRPQRVENGEGDERQDSRDEAG